MKFLKVLDEEGEYIDIQKQRCNLLSCHEVIGPRTYEFIEFDNIEDAEKAYKLTKII